MLRRHSTIRRTTLLSTVGLATLAMPIARDVLNAQSAASQAAAATFEVVSIKRNTSGGPARSLIQPGGRLSAVNTPVFQIVRQAYDVLPFQVLNAPDWVTSERYDILAKAPEGVAVMRSIAPLLRSLLHDRFTFEAHTETREMPIYELVVARQDRRLGAGIQPSPVDCTASMMAPARRQGSDGGAGAPSPPSDEPPCAQLGTPGRYVMRGFPLSQLARILGSPVNRLVVDKTGLAGTWNLVLEFTPDQMPNIASGALPPGVTLPPPDAPSLFTAIQEQLGLKLESARGPVDVLVVDRIERPSED
jgi:uncharacterized protein (TIGR03435 family)